MSMALSFQTHKIIELFATNIFCRKITSSYEITVATMEIFKDIIAKEKWNTADELMLLVRNQGRVLVSALPQESVTANVARRILKLIREEYDNVQHRVIR